MCMLMTVLSSILVAMLLIYFFDQIIYCTSTVTFSRTQLHQQTKTTALIKYLSVLCPRGWVLSFHGECFQFHSNLLHWSSAKSACEALGSNLAVLNSKAKLQDFPVSAAPVAAISLFWIGLYKDPINKLRWLWVGGSNFPFTSWSIGQPSSAARTQACGAIRMSSKKWYDGPCSGTRLPYICEINGK